MKLGGCIQFTLSFCIVEFLTSVSYLKPEVGRFSKNRKSEPEVGTGSRNYAQWEGNQILLLRLYPYLLIFWPGEAPETFEKFCPLCKSIWTYPDKNDSGAYQNWGIKKRRYDSRYKTHELSNEILFDFRSRWLELPVYEKQLISGLRLETEVKKLTLQKLRVNCIHPQSFIGIGWRV